MSHTTPEETILKQQHIFNNLAQRRGFPRGVMVKAVDCGIIVSKFELQSDYYVHFRTNTLGKDMNPPYPPRSRLNSITTVILEGWIWHKK